MRQLFPSLLATSFLVSTALLGGCASTPTGPAAGLQPAAVTSQELSVPEQSITDFKVRWDGVVQSPEPATLERVTWELVVDGAVVKKGEEKMGLALPANTAVPLQLEQSGRYVESAEELKKLGERAGSLLVALRGKLHVERLGTKDVLDFARSRDIRLPRLPVPGLREVEGSRYSAENVSLRFYVTINNPNPFPLKVDGLTYTAVVGGKQLSDGTLAPGNTVNPTETDVFEFTVVLDPATYGPEVKKLIAGQSIPYKVSGKLDGDLFSVPFEAEGVVLVRSSQ